MIDTKCFKQKLYGSEREEGIIDKKVSLIWPWVASLRSNQGHIDFFKRNTIFYSKI